MIGALVKKQFAESFRSYFYDEKKQKARSKLAVAMYFVLFAVIMVGLLGGIFGFLAYTLCGALVSAGFGWMYFVIMGLIAVFLGAFGSVFNTYSGLYLSKDNDLLLSMPIKIRDIIISRLLGVYLMGLMYSGVVLIPTVVIYWIMESFTASNGAGCLLMCLLVSVFVLILSCLLGWVVAKISQKLKNKSFITVLLSVAFIALYYVFYFKANTVIQDIILNIGVYGDKLKGSAYILYLFGRMGEGDFLAMLIIGLLVAALTAITWFLLKKSFTAIAISAGNVEKVRYTGKAIKARSVKGALYAKEVARFTGNANYMLNCGLGLLLLPVIGVVLVVKKDDIGAVFATVDTLFTGGLLPLLCVIMSAGASTTDITAPSVSLEGKSIWICQSLPVSAFDVLMSKFRMQVIFSGISLAFCIVCVSWALSLSVGYILLLTAFTAVYLCMSSLLGLVVNLKHPNLTWTNEITVIKQSLGVFINLMGGWAISAVIFAGYMLLANTAVFGTVDSAAGNIGGAPVVYVLAVTVIIAVAAAVMYSWIRKKGSGIFARL